MSKTLNLLLLLFVIASCNNSSHRLFNSLDFKKTNIKFSNILIENDSINILNYEYFYNGAGVALADVNNDGLLDIFFTGNQVDNELYLNKGNLIFENISNQAKISKPNPSIWSSGVSIIDINNDDLLDIYISNTLRKDKKLRKNLLYVNQGVNNDKIPVFKEMSSEYDLSDDSYSSSSHFFDFDNDGDLDVFIGVSQLNGMNPNVYRDLSKDKNPISVDKLLENTWDDKLYHPVFNDVSVSAGIKFQGQTNSLLINDFNLDGWQDIYVGNDFLSNDILYINNKDKTFKNSVGQVFKHFSLSSMGSDISDINNDGKLDLFVSEMQPYYNKRKKLFNRKTNYRREQITRKYNYEYQYFRNVLQLNIGINPNTKLPLFSEIGMHSGVNETGWSWSSVFADFDNDGWNDLFIANGFPKDILDKDFSDFRNNPGRYYTTKLLLKEIPEVKTRNFIFKNNKDFKFIDMSESWGIDSPSHSNGAAYGDLDNDGDIDLVINNVNDKASVLENLSLNKDSLKNYVRFKLSGNKTNKIIYGSTLTLFREKSIQKQLLTPQRGYLSQSETILHFGLGASKTIDSVQIRWTGGEIQSFFDIKINKINHIYRKLNQLKKSKIKEDPILNEVSKSAKILYLDSDLDFDDFLYQSTIPKKFSQNGPSLAVADLNNDNLEDLLIGGNSKFKQTIFFQKKNGQFTKKPINLKSDIDLLEEDSGIFIFDVENDGDNDIYIVRGSAQFPEKSEFYKDALWINDGKGNFSDFSYALPVYNSNGTAVKGADFDRDGDIDLFVGGGTKPSNYPIADSSYLLENESTEDKIYFKNSSNKIKFINPIGIVNDALWTDFNNDNLLDLIILSEWSSIKFFENNGGILYELSETGIEKYLGWWNSITPSDIDNDGDLDYLVGNFGTNTLFKADFGQPISVIGKDFDLNGSMELFISFFARDSIGNKKKYIYHVWEDLVKQYPYFRKHFNSHGKYGLATSNMVFDKIDLSNSVKLNANFLNTSWVENLGNNKFKIHLLPAQCQFSPIYGILKTDVNGDEFDDFMLVGNNFGVEPNQGRLDAINGIILENTGKKGFKVLDLNTTNFLVQGDAKSIVKLTNKNKLIKIISQNNDSLRVYESNKLINNKLINWMKNEFKCVINFQNGASKILYRIDNQSFQSQSSENFVINNMVESVDFFSDSDLLLRSLKNE